MSSNVYKRGSPHSLRNLIISGLQVENPAEDIVKLPVPLDYGEYVRTIAPPGYAFDAKHFKLIFDHINAVNRREIDRLAVFMPPRHGKTSTITVPLPAHVLERDPTQRVLVTGYNVDVARKFSRQTRNIVSERLGLAKDKTAATEWETPLRGGMMARGVGNPPTGFGYNLLIIDDPIRSRKDAESLSFRDKVYDWYTDDLYTRLEPKAAIIMILTRWHFDDLAARVIDSDPTRWTILKLPALAEANDPLGRSPGEALWPERYNKEELESIRRVQTKKFGSLSFESLYQQNPVPRDGNIFKVTKILSVDMAPEGLNLCRAWDFAASDSDKADYTVGVLMGFDSTDETYYVLDIVREQFTTNERDKLILETARSDPKGTKIFLPQDPGAAGKSQVAYHTKMLRGFTVKSELVTGEKALRADPLASQVNISNVRFVKAHWNPTAIDELMKFPFGAHDDIVDAMSDAFRICTDSGLGFY